MRTAASILVAAALWTGAAAAETVRIGVTAGPHAEIAEALVPVAKARGLDVKVVEFNEGARVNIALNDGDLEANAFQHKPYLDNQARIRNLDLVKISDTVLLPMAAYSRRHKTLAELPEKAVIAIPNDPTNAGRAFKLLQQGGLIGLRSGAGVDASVLDITDNPKSLRIRELEAVQIPRSLDDVDLAVINTNFAIHAGLNPQHDSLLRETAQSAYVCLIAVRRADADKPWVKTLVESYLSPEVRAFVEKRYQGSILAIW